MRGRQAGALMHSQQAVINNRDNPPPLKTTSNSSLNVLFVGELGIGVAAPAIEGVEAHLTAEIHT